MRRINKSDNKFPPRLIRFIAIWFVAASLALFLLPLYRPRMVQHDEFSASHVTSVAYAWLAEMKADDPRVRTNAAARVFFLIGPHADALAPVLVPALTTMLSDSEQSVRCSAARSLRVFGVLAAPAAQKLGSLLREGNNDVAWAAAESLAAIGSEARIALPDLMWAAVTTDDNAIPGSGYEDVLRSRAVHAIVAIGNADPDVIAALRQTADTSSGRLRVDSLSALCRLSCRDLGDWHHRAVASLPADELRLLLADVTFIDPRCRRECIWPGLRLALQRSDLDEQFKSWVKNYMNDESGRERSK